MRTVAIVFVILAITLGASIGGQSRLGQIDGAEEQELRKLVATLRTEVQQLRNQVNFLLIPHRYDEVELGYLRELVRLQESLYKQASAKAGFPGGGTADQAMTRHSMFTAKARLAWAQGQAKECLEHCDAAVAAGKLQVEAFEASYQTGRTQADFLLQAQSQLIESKLRASRTKRMMEMKRVN